MSSAIVGFLHTSPVHVPTFDALLAGSSHAESTSAHHAVDVSLLDRARDEGMTDAVQEDTRGAIEALAADGASVVVCTCSTLAGFAETLSTDSLTVIRIDRPMAREAIRLAEAGSGRISLLAALDSALPPGLELLEEEAAGTSTTIESTLVEEAWVAFEAGDQRGYLGRIAAAIEQAATDGTDVIVLAQASMAGAADQARTEVPVLASPALAVAAALEASGR